MKIKKIRLKNFRNYEDLELDPHGSVNLFFGQNGSGKTNLLEAIHYCALGKSHRVSHDRNTVMIGQAFGACGIELERIHSDCNIAVKMLPGENTTKSIFIDKKKITKLSDLMGRLQCVIFSPEDLELIREGPSVRRRYIDMLLSQISVPYFIALQQYRKAMEQRNAILKKMKYNEIADSFIMEEFENAMIRPAETIIPERKKYIEILNQYASECYCSISGRDNEKLTIEYQSSVKEEDIEKALIEGFKKSLHEDIMTGNTSVGPHRDDLQIRLNGKNMKLYASQGQVRTAALSLKLAQLRLYKDVTGDTPILLLDDVMSELDMTRRVRLLKEIENVQTFITCTDQSDLEECEDKRVYRVQLDEDAHATITQISSGDDEQKAIFEEPDFN